MQLVEDGRVAVGAVVFLVAHPRVTDTRPLAASRASSRCTAPVPQPARRISSVAKNPTRLAEQEAEHALLHAREQRIGESGSRQIVDTHIGNINSLFGKVQRWACLGALRLPIGGDGVWVDTSG